jgi:hypothetical protein
MNTNPTCTRAIELLDDYVFTPHTLTETEKTQIQTHLETCDSCKSAYTELTQWKTLAETSKYHASDELKQSILDRIEAEKLRLKRALIMKKRMTRISTIAASFVLVTVTAIVVIMMQRDAATENMTAKDAAMDVQESNDVITQFSDAQNEGAMDEGAAEDYAGSAPEEAKLFAVPAPAAAQLPEPALADMALPEEAAAEPDAAPEAEIAEPSAEIMEAAGEANTETYKILTLITNEDYIDAVNKLDYAAILYGENAVNSWVEAENAKSRTSENPPLYDAIVQFNIDKDTLLWLDSQSTSKDYYLGEDVINAIYDMDWEYLTTSMGE